MLFTQAKSKSSVVSSSSVSVVFNALVIGTVLLFCLLFGNWFPVTSLQALAEMSSFITLAQWRVSDPNPKWMFGLSAWPKNEQGVRCLHSHCEAILGQAQSSMRTSLHCIIAYLKSLKEELRKIVTQHSHFWFVSFCFVIFVFEDHLLLVNPFPVCVAHLNEYTFAYR